MSRPLRIGLITVAGVAVLLLLALGAGVLLIRSDWFFNQVRERVVAELHKATGGTVELQSFHLDWKTMTAEAEGLVIHGTEPPGEEPLFRAAKITIGLKVISMVKRQFDVASVDVIDPRTNLLFAADGTTNVPKPPGPASGKTADQTILDLAVGLFSAQNGMIQIKAAGAPPQSMPWTARGEKLKARLNYSESPASYSGDISMEPLHAGYGSYGPIDAAVDLSLKFERDHIQVTKGRLQTATSRVDFNGDARNLRQPRITGDYQAHLAAQEVERLLAWRTPQGGQINSSGQFQFNGPEDYSIRGNLAAVDLTYRDPDMHFDHVQVTSRFVAGPKKIEMTGMSASLLGGHVQGSATVTYAGAFDIRASVAGFAADGLADLLKTDRPPFDALISGPFEARGTFAGLKDRRVDASAKLTLSPVGKTPVSGLIDARYDGRRQYVDLAQSWLALPSSRAEFSGGLAVQKGDYQANLQLRLASTDLHDLLLVAPLVKDLPLSLQNGHAEFNGTLSGPLNSPVIAGHVTANNIVIEKQTIEAVSADVDARSTQLQVRNGVLAYQNMRARLAGTLGLVSWKPDNRSAVSAMASLQNADIANVLALAGQTQIPVKGALSAEAQLNGTVADPRATATLRGGKGIAYGEPFDRATANLTYLNGGRQEFTAEVDAGPRKVNLTGSFQHSPTDFLEGAIQANVKTSDIALNQVQRIREYQPTISGTARATVDTVVRLLHTKAGEQFEVTSLNADLTTHTLAIDNKQFGDAHFTAHSVPDQSQPVVKVEIESNLAHSTIRGNGSWTLAGDYPGSGEVTFTQVNVADVRRLLAPNATSLASVGGTIEGKITFRGSAEKWRTMAGTVEISKLEIKPEPGAAAPLPESLRDVVIRNQAPIRAAMTNGNLTILTARVTARSTDLNIAGSVNLNSAAPLNLRASGNVDLSILPMFERDLVSSGTVAASATVRGTFAQPEILGRMDVKNANLNLEGLPNGLSNANGTVIFDPSRATIQSMTAETGGGKVNLTGFASFSNGPMAFHLEASAKEVRVRYPEGVSTVADFGLRLIGTTERSTLSGTITVLRSAFTPRTDLGSLMTTATAPVQTPAVQTGLVGNMQFDVDIVTAPDVSFKTSVTQGLQADADLRLRGTVSNPVLLGRINISQGDLTFFGNKYTINDGTISFFNPVKLEPILNVSLETRARGVDVTINVIGPVSKPRVSYRSDPPLQFADLVALLATGRTPENPNLAIQSAGTTQTWQEMGASALLGQAIANPLAGRLQRFFGVSKIKIDPLLTGVAGNAQARLTIEQNITPDITFTYITNVNSSTGSAQVIRMEWDFSHHWSAVAVRDEYGYFGIDFQYRKRLK